MPLNLIPRGSGKRRAELWAGPAPLRAPAHVFYNPAQAMKAVELALACFLLLGACLVWPLLAIANRPVLVLGIPALVLYLFGVWAVMVMAAALVARRTRPPEAPEG